jgi:hypothetical protein
MARNAQFQIESAEPIPALPLKVNGPFWLGGGLGLANEANAGMHDRNGRLAPAVWRSSKSDVCSGAIDAAAGQGV